MPLELAEKILLGSAAVLGTATTSIGTHYIFDQPSTIGEALQKQGFKFLEEEKTWEDLVKKYKDEGTTSPSKIQDLKLSNDSDDTENKDKQTLKEKCKNLWDTKISTNKENQERITEEIKNWCIEKPKALEEKTS